MDILKKRQCLFLTMCLLLFLFVGCSTDKTNKTNEVEVADAAIKYDENMEIYYEDSSSGKLIRTEIQLSEEKKRELIDQLSPYEDKLSYNVIKKEFLYCYVIKLNENTTLQIDGECEYSDDGKITYMFVMQKNKKPAFIQGVYIDYSIIDILKNGKNTGESLTYCQENKVSFEDIVKNSNVAIVGEYIETIDYEQYSEARFKVKECLYGDVDEEEIYLFINHAVSYVSEIDYTYEHNGRQYKEGSEYILVMEKNESIMYDHDRFALQTDLFLSEEDGQYTLYSKPIAVPDNMDIKEYIRSLYYSVPREEKTRKNSEEYNDLIEQLVAESKIIAVVNINKIETEGRLHNGNTYRCTIEEFIKEAKINTYDDGTILIVIEKDLVEAGNKYILGFDPVEENSLIHMQSIKNGVWPEESEIKEMIIKEMTDKSIE